VIILNFKAYDKASGDAGYLLAKTAREVASLNNKRVVVCPTLLDLKEYCKRLKQFNEFLIFAEYADANNYGAFTGSIPPAQLKAIGVSGVILNHAERKLQWKQLEATVKECKRQGLVTVVCAASIAECKKCASLSPYAVAYEPPELIGTGISVSSAKPKVVQKALEAVKKENSKVLFLIGAGVSNPDDVSKSLELGAKGVILASAFVKAKNPKKWLQAMVSEVSGSKRLCCKNGTCMACRAQAKGK
jgi:triosephosphate isomerase